MIQSAISLYEDSLHKHTRHAEDVVILRLIVCVSDVSNHHQTRGGFTLPLSPSFSAFPSDCTNCPIVLLLLQSPISSASAQEVQLKGAHRQQQIHKQSDAQYMEGLYTSLVMSETPVLSGL